MARTRIAARKKVIETPRLKVINPGKGLNVQTSDNLIDNREASNLGNMQFVESGAISKRNGFTQFSAALSNNPMGLGTYTPTSGTRYVVTIDGTTLKYTTGSSWSSASGSTFTSGLTTTFTQARGTLYVWNGTEGGTTFNGSACARPGTMPKAKFALFYKGYHFAAGVDGQLNRLYISVVTDAADFTNASTTLNDSTEVPGATVFAGSGANFVDVDKDDGDKITGLATFQDSVIIFKERAIHQLTLDSSGTPSVALITRSMGCVSHKTIDNAENDVFFLSRHGIYVLGNEPNYFTSIRTNELSARINPRIKLISEANLSQSTAIYFDYRYWLGVPEGGTTANNLLWTYDRRYLAWAKSKTGTFNPEAFTIYIDNNSREKLLFTDATSTYVYEVDQTYNDNNNAIDAFWQSKAFDNDEFDIEKRWLYVDLQFRQISGGISISIYTDGNTLAASTSIPSPTSSGEMGTQLLGEELLGGDPDVMEYTNPNTASINVPYRVPIRKNSRTIKIKVSNSTINENFVLSGIIFGFIPFTQYKFNSSNKLQVT